MSNHPWHYDILRMILEWLKSLIVMFKKSLVNQFNVFLVLYFDMIFIQLNFILND